MTRASQGTSAGLRWVALDKHVLLVAKEGKVETWYLSIGAVTGKDYEKEAAEVATGGSGVPSLFGRIYFEDLSTKSTQEYHFPAGWSRSMQQRQDKLIAEGKPLYDDPRIIELEPLDWHVLLVAAKVGTDGWVAYIGAVEGKDYDKEAVGVVANGSEIPYEMAEVYFEDLTRTPDLKWRGKTHSPTYIDVQY